MKTSKMVALGMALVMVLSLMAGCGTAVPKETAGTVATAAPAKLKIGVSIANYDDKWLSYLLDSMQAYTKTIPDVEFIFVDGKNDLNNQLGVVENFIAQGVNAMVINPVDTDGSGPMTDKAKAAGIPIVSVNRPFKNQVDAASYCGGDEKQSGVLEMEYLAKKLNGKGNVVIMLGEPGLNSTISRTAGFKEVLAKYPDMKVVAEQSAFYDRAKGMALMETWLQSGMKIDAVASNNDEMAIGAIKAIQAEKMTGKIIVGGIDASPDALAFLKSGDEAVTIFQDANGQAVGSLEVAIKVAKGQPVEKIYSIPFQLVAPTDADKYLAIWGIK
jgi:inositol transport system substrate-binding protein